MFRHLTIFTLTVGFVAEASADIPPSPPPTGQKYVSVVNQVRLGKEFDDYVFFIAHGHGPGRRITSTQKITLSTKNATPMPRGGRYQYIALLAVPKASADQVQSDDPGAFASDRSKIPGLKRIGFADTATVDGKHPGGSVTRTYTITGFDKDGELQTTVEREPADAEGEKKSKSRAEVGPGKTSTAVAAIAVALSIALGGFLLVRKRRAPFVQTRD